MHICYDLRKIDLTTHHRPVVTLGTFDGVHLGHQKLLDFFTRKAKETGKKSVLITYHPHPRQVLYPNEPFHLLTTLEEKIELLDKLGLDELIVLNFDSELAQTTARQFVNDILVGKLHPSCVVAGYDHRFGKGREGNLELLEEAGRIFGFELAIVPAIKEGEEMVSSTKIRKAFATGDFARGRAMLGHSYPLTGIVQMGTGLGKKLGYPTCNLKLSEDKLLPPAGIYSCSVKVNHQPMPAMAYVGTRPTLSADPALTAVEVHILDFEGTLYEQKLSIYLEEWVRGDEKFASLEELKDKIKQDEKTIRAKHK